MNHFEMFKRNCTRLLFFFIIIIVIKISFGAFNCSPTNEYIIKTNRGSACLLCNNCPVGHGLKLPCGSILEKKDDIDCKPCISGKTYSDKHSPESCKPCGVCSRHEIVKSNCTTEADTICSSKCEKGYYYQRNTYDCHPCSRCCNDTKDVVKSDCIAHGMPVTHRCSVDQALVCPLKTTLAKSTHAAPSNNTSTSRPTPPQPPSTTTTETTTRAKTPTTTAPTATTTATTRASTGTTTTTTTTTTAATFPTVTARKGPQDRVWMIGGCAIAFISFIICIICNIRREMPDDNPDLENPVVENRSSYFNNPVYASVCSTCTFLRNELRLRLIPIAPQKDCREGEKCIISCQMWKKTRVNFDEKHFAFTWNKDSAKLEGQYLKELKLEILKVSDFGTYECFVECSKHAGTNNTKIKSKELFLDVMPGPDRRYKRLNDLPRTAKEKIARFLSRKIPGVGNWTTVAELYEIPNEDIELIDPRYLKDGSDYDSAICTLEIIESRCPKETVYNFCKCLKKIKQNAIVEILEDYLVCEDKEKSECSSSQWPTVDKIDSETSKDEQEEPKSIILGSNKVMPSRDGFPSGQKNGAYKDEGCIPGQATERNTELSADNAGANNDK